VQQLQNALLSSFRGTASDPYGDVTDSFVPYLVNLPGALVESSKQVLDPATQMPRTVRTVTCVVPSWADVLDTDTVQDQGSGRMFEIHDITLQPSLGVPPDLVLTLRERSAAGITSD
jgi:hypothetical protein